MKKFFIISLLLALCVQLTYGQQSASISTSEIINTEAVYFDFGKHDLRLDDIEKLETMIAQLKENESFILKITAHTDAIGTDGANQALSERRGETVRSFLITKGVPDSLVQVAVYGESAPVADNVSDGGRQQNRRATIEMIVPKPVKNEVEKVVDKTELKEPEIPMGLVEGRVVDKKTGEPILSTVIIRSKTFRDSIQTDEKGFFSKEVPVNSVIGIDVFAPGYFFESQMMKVSGLNLPTLEFQLPPANLGAVAEIKDLFYVGNKAVLLKRSEPILPKVLLFMQVNKDIKIEIGGHVNYPKNKTAAYSKGAGPFEQSLSDRRAKMVYQYLLDNGIPEDRMSWKGYSNTQMKFPRTRLEREMAKNRRVEIKVVE